MYRLYMHCTVTQHLCIELWQKKKVAAQIIQEIKHTEKKKNTTMERKSSEPVMIFDMNSHEKRPRGSSR